MFLTTDVCIPIPDDLIATFWAGGGHNSAGTEAGAMSRWTNANLKLLHRAARSSHDDSSTD